MNSNTEWTNGSTTMQSPKKKLHIKVTQNNGTDMAEAVSTVRNSLKHAKDISARNLMAHQDHHPSAGAPLKYDEDSDYETVVAIEEEPTDYTPYRETSADDDDDDDETEEEIVEVEVEVEYDEEVMEESTSTEEEEDNDEDEDLEPLPPPIVIPKALSVKDETFENQQDSSESSASDDEAAAPDAEEVARKLALSRSSTTASKPICVLQEVEKEEVIEQKLDIFDECPKSPPRKPLDDDIAARPGTIRGYSYNPELKNPNAPIKKWTPSKQTDGIKEELPPVSPKRAPASPKRSTDGGGGMAASNTESDTTTTKSPNGTKKWKRPTPVVIGAPKRAPSLRQLDVEGRPDISWTKPDWAASGPKLRSTGKSAAENLAKPITNLPHMNKNCIDDDNNNNNNNYCNENITNNNTEAAAALEDSFSSRKAASKIICKAPEPDYLEAQTEQPKPSAYPKSPGKGSIKKPVMARALPPPAALDLTADDEHKPIEWEKPDWAKKRVLRATSKTETLYSGKDIARPIGGIRPLEDRS